MNNNNNNLPNSIFPKHSQPLALNENEHPFYGDPTSFQRSFYEIITLDGNLIREKSKNYHSRPYTSFKLISETAYDD